jgi:hypothetical protein
LRKFGGWNEKVSDLRGEKKYVDGKEIYEPKTSLADDDILYLQENHVVTHGIFKDEHVVFDEVTDEWKAFCHDDLKFEIPDYAKPEKNEIRANVATAGAGKPN